MDTIAKRDPELPSTHNNRISSVQTFFSLRIHEWSYLQAKYSEKQAVHDRQNEESYKVGDVGFDKAGFTNGVFSEPQNNVRV